MLDSKTVPSCIEAIFPCQFIKVEGNGHHFFTTIVSNTFSGKNQLARHCLIKKALTDKISSNELHALSITTAATPEERKTQNG